MTFQSILNSEIETGAIIDTQLLTKVKDNFEEHETEMTAIQVAPPLVVVGTIVHSMLTLAQYTALAGAGWVLANGASAIGSTYHAITGNTNVPDLRGVALRGKDNGRGLNPDGDLALGTYQADAFQGHKHSINHGYDGGAGSVWVAGTGGGGRTGTVDHGILSPISDGTNGTPRTTSETRMKNVTVNIFIKIN